MKPSWRAYLKHQQLHTNWKHKLAAWNNWTSLFSTELNIRTSLIVLPQATPLCVTGVGCNHTQFDLRYNVLTNLNSCITHHWPLLYTSEHQKVNLQPPSDTSGLHGIGRYIHHFHTHGSQLRHLFPTWRQHVVGIMTAVRYSQAGDRIPEGSQVRHLLPTRRCCQFGGMCRNIAA